MSMIVGILTFISRINTTAFDYDLVCSKLRGLMTGLRNAVGNVSGNRCESDCRSRGREFDPGPVPYFPED